MAISLKSPQALSDSKTLNQLLVMAKRMEIEVTGNPKKIEVAKLIVAKQHEIIDANAKSETTEQAHVEPVTEQLPLVEQSTEQAPAVESPSEVEPETTEQASVEPATDEATEKTPVIIHPATDEAPSEVAKVFTIYTTADPSLDDEILKAEEKITRTLLNVKTLTGMRLYQIDLNECSRGDVVSQLGDYLFNGHNALTRSQWLKLVSDTELAEGNKIKFPALVANKVTEEKIKALVELEDPTVDPFVAERNQQRIAEIQTQIAALQEELRTLKKSTKSKSIGGSGLVIRQNVFKTGTTFDETIKMCELIESDGYEVASEQFNKTMEYVKRAHRAYSELYLKSEVIKNLFDAKKISWAAIYKIAGSNPAKVGMAAIEAKALAVAKD